MSDIPHNAVTRVGPAMAPKLEATQGENKGETFTVKLTTRLGRERDNDVVLLDLKSSRHHAEVKLDDGQWILVDLDSANGTLLNNKPANQPTPLKHGDRIRIGETELVFKMPGEPDIEPAPAAAVTGPPTPAEVPRRGAASGQIPVVTSPQKRTQPPRLALIAGGVILLVCVAAMVIIYFATNRLVYPSDSTSENISPPSQNSTPNGSTGGQDTGGQPVSTLPPEARPTDLALVYEDDFSDSFGGWDDAFDEYTRKVYGNNRYNIEVNASNLVAWGLANRIVSDFEVEVEAKLEDGGEENSYGLLFRFQDRDNFYRFDISGDGYYLFSKFVDGEWVTLVDWTESEFINTGNVPNILKVSAFGPNITLSVNGQQLTTLIDNSIERGNFGFFAGTFAEPVSWVSFDNLKMSTPPDEEIVLVPTATPIGATPIGEVAVAAEATLTLTPLPPTPEPEAPETATTESESASVSPVATPTATPRPTREPTPTPQPLAEYVSRDQTLARGKSEEVGRIVFPVYDAERGIYDIYMADIADGDNLTLIQESASQPALTQDGAEIAYRSWQPDKRGLFARAIGENPLDAWGYDLFFESARPQFSPADSSLMYHSRTSGTEPATYRVIDGVGAVMRREGAPIQGKSPKWSPDGQQFVYSGCNGSTCGIIISNVDGGAPAQLTDNPDDTNPEISPDGSTIAFMSDRGGNWEIYRMDIDGQNLKALTTNKDSDGLPTWSPDGSRIAFVSNRDGEWSVWVMGADGSDKRRQFVVEGAIDGIVRHDIVNSFGWTEENIDWIP